jgi:hypothetical protein
MVYESGVIPTENPLASSIPERVPFKLLLEHVGEGYSGRSREDLVEGVADPGNCAFGNQSSGDNTVSNRSVYKSEFCVRVKHSPARTTYDSSACDVRHSSQCTDATQLQSQASLREQEVPGLAHDRELAEGRRLVRRFIAPYAAISAAIRARWSWRPISAAISPPMIPKLNSQSFHIRNAIEQMQSVEDPWKDFSKERRPLRAALARLPRTAS